MNTTKLIETCHNAAKSKGFWDKERNQAEAFALILSELYEAFEAHRKGKFCRYFLPSLSTEFPNFKSEFERAVKDTLEDELADVLIRCFDFCGGFKIENLNFSIPIHIDLQFKRTNNFGEKVLIINAETSVAYYTFNSKAAITIMYHYVMYLCQELNIDIETHINLKLAYNATRAKLHGKNY